MTQEDIYMIHIKACIFSLVEEMAEQFNLTHADALRYVLSGANAISHDIYGKLSDPEISELYF